MKKIILVTPKLNKICATAVLEENEFQVISNWVENNIYAKGGVEYKLSHPVWTFGLTKVRIEKR